MMQDKNNTSKQCQLAQIELLAQKLLDEKFIPTEIGVRQGKLGVILFYLSYNKLIRNSKYKKYAYSLLEEVFCQINGGFLESNIEGQLAEFGWFLEMVGQKQLLEFGINSNDILWQVDNLQEGNLKKAIHSGDIDMLSGLLLCGYYYLSRYKDKPKVKKYLSDIVKSIDYWAIIDKEHETACWRSKLLHNRIYLGISHGAASIILFLYECLKLDIEVNLCKRLIEEASNFILLQEYSVPINNCRFPYYIGYTGDQYDPLEWCYGELSIMYSIYIGASALGINKAERYAKKVLKNVEFYASLRVEDVEVHDHSLLNGICGVSLLFKRFYEMTSNSKFDASSIYWMNKLILHWNPSTNHTDYLYHQGHQNYIGKNVGLLSGDAGVGLFLLEQINPDINYYRKFLFL